MVKDSVSNLIIGLKNAGNAGKAVAVFPYTKLSLSILELLKKENYIEDLEVVEKTSVMKEIKVTLKYNNGNHAINDVKRVSKFSQRIYRGVKSIMPVKSGYGMLVLTTPNGVLSDKTAKEQNVGGEALFKIW